MAATDGPGPFRGTDGAETAAAATRPGEGAGARALPPPPAHTHRPLHTAQGGGGGTGSDAEGTGRFRPRSPAPRGDDTPGAEQWVGPRRSRFLIGSSSCLSLFPRPAACRPLRLG